MKKIFSLEECLSDAYCSGVFNPQDDRLMWAILEGLRRLNIWKPPWRSVQAHKEHKCVRKCSIAAYDIYFLEDAGQVLDYSTAPKFCPGCMAMILYFKEVYDLPPISYTHWNMEMKKPVKIEREGTQSR